MFQASSRLVMVWVALASLLLPIALLPTSAEAATPAPTPPTNDTAAGSAASSQTATPAPAAGAPAAPNGLAPVPGSNVGPSGCTTDPCQSSAPAAAAAAGGAGFGAGLGIAVGALGAGAAAGQVGATVGATVGAVTDPEALVQRFLSTLSQGVLSFILGDENDARGGILGYVITELIGGDDALSNPVVSCEQVASGGGDCQPWFIEQLAMMRQFGLWLLVPLVMLAVIQAVVRGSIFLVFRAATIMVPVAVIGSVLLASFTQLLLNIADDFTAAMFSFYGDDFEALRQGIAAYNEQTLSLFGLVFAIGAALAGIVITVELVVREVGVYITVLFLPLLFAGLVWPVTARWARRMTEVLIALIFSKVFIAGGIALGLGAIEAAGSRGIESQGLLSIANAAAIFIIAAVFGVRLLDWAPLGSDARAGRLAQPSNVWGMGEALSMAAGNRGARIMRARNNLTPGRSGFNRN